MDFLTIDHGKPGNTLKFFLLAGEHTVLANCLIFKGS